MTMFGAPSMPRARGVTASGSYTVSVRWGRWCLGLLLLGLLLAPVTVMFARSLSAGPAPALLLLGGFLLVLLAAVLIFLVQGATYADAGHVLRANAQGLAIAGFPMVAWRGIVGLDLQMIPTRWGAKTWALHVALDPSTATRLARGWWGRHVVRMVSEQRQVAVVPLGFSREPAAEVLAGVRAIATWAGAPIASWSYMVPVASAVAARVAAQEASETVREATVATAGVQALLEAGAPAGADRTAAMQRMALATGRAVEAARGLVDAQERLQKESRRSFRHILWGGVALLVFGVLLRLAAMG